MHLRVRFGAEFIPHWVWDLWNICFIAYATFIVAFQEDASVNLFVCHATILMRTQWDEKKFCGICNCGTFCVPT